MQTSKAKTPENHSNSKPKIGDDADRYHHACPPPFDPASGNPISLDFHSIPRDNTAFSPNGISQNLPEPKRPIRDHLEYCWEYWNEVFSGERSLKKDLSLGLGIK